MVENFLANQAFDTTKMAIAPVPLVVQSGVKQEGLVASLQPSRGDTSLPGHQNQSLATSQQSAIPIFTHATPGSQAPLLTQTILVGNQPGLAPSQQILTSSQQQLSTTDLIATNLTIKQQSGDVGSHLPMSTNITMPTTPIMVTSVNNAIQLPNNQSLLLNNQSGAIQTMQSTIPPNITLGTLPETSRVGQETTHIQPNIVLESQQQRPSSNLGNNVVTGLPQMVTTGLPQQQGLSIGTAVIQDVTQQGVRTIIDPDRVQLGNLNIGQYFTPYNNIQ